MRNLRKLMTILNDMVITAEKNSRYNGVPIKDEDVIMRTMNGDTVTVSLIKNAMREMRSNTLPAIVPSRAMVVYTRTLVEISNGSVSETGDMEIEKNQLHNGGIICLGYRQ